MNKGGPPGAAGPSLFETCQIMQSHDHEPKPGTHNLAAVVSPLSLLEKPQKDLKFNATTPHTIYLGKVGSSMKGCSHLKAELNIVLNAKKDSANAGFRCEIVKDL